MGFKVTISDISSSLEKCIESAVCKMVTSPPGLALIPMVKDHGSILEKIDVWRKYVEWRLRK